MLSEPSTVALRVENLSKRYALFHSPMDRIRQSVNVRTQRLLGRELSARDHEFDALKNVSFSVARGQTVGIVGRNGSGKSTLLQLICGTLSPTSGTVNVNGRIAALLELGAGFNPDYTGRENVFLNSAILGLSHKETEEKMEDILAFADIGRFIDQPVKAYSSGMFVRLAFATAINTDPDILIVDEALAVGDEAFQRKCFSRIQQIQEQGATVLFVSHSAQSVVQLCDRAILLDRGELILEGSPKTVVEQYQRFMNLTGDDAENVRNAIIRMNAEAQPVSDFARPLATDQTVNFEQDSVGSRKPTEAVYDESFFDPGLKSESRIDYECSIARISDVRIEDSFGQSVNCLPGGGRRYRYCYRVTFMEDAEEVGFGMMIKNKAGFELGGATTNFSRKRILERVRAGSVLSVSFELNWALTPGIYFMNAGVSALIDGESKYAHRILDAIAVRIMPTAETVATSFIDFGAEPRIELFESAEYGERETSI